MPYWLNFSKLDIPKMPAAPQWVLDSLPKRERVDIQYQNGAWLINGKPVHRTPFIKTGAYRKNLVAMSVQAAIRLRGA